MDATDVLTGATAAVKELADQLADVIGSLPQTELPIPGDEWTVQEACAHLIVVASLYQEFVAGRPSPVRLPGDSPAFDGARYREVQAAYSAQWNAGVVEKDPATLARRLREEAARLVDATSATSADQPVSFHCGTPTNVAGLICVYLGELLVHGYDLARVAGRPWPIDPGHAALTLYGYGPCMPMIVNRETTRGHSAAYGIELRGVGDMVIRFDDGEYGLEEAGSVPVDCTISADPVAWLLMASGRLDLWPAVALGLISFGGEHPELGVGFKDLFIFP